MLPALTYQLVQISGAMPGMNIRVIRTRQKRSQASLAEISGIERHHLSDIELGKVNISLQTMERICKALGCQFPDLFDGINLKSKKKR